jgi:phosphoketolase
MNTRALTPEQLHKMDAYWRAANYLSVGQIYLYDNPLLKWPLTLADVKHMLVWSKYSCRFPMVIFQQPTQSFLTTD